MDPRLIFCLPLIAGAIGSISVVHGLTSMVRYSLPEVSGNTFHNLYHSLDRLPEAVTASENWKCRRED